jgi:L-asparaginase
VQKNKVIHFIITGGTIDSVYDGSKDTVIPSKESIIPEVIKSMKLYETDVEFTTVCMKDSRALNQEDRQQMLEVVEQSKATKIIITHGTYTMPDTARYLKAHIKRTDQTIIFTASAIPIKGFSPSDGTFNLGYAVAKVEDLPAGIYVCINGYVFTPDEVMKNLSEGTFSSIFNK